LGTDCQRAVWKLFLRGILLQLCAQMPERDRAYRP
jgi:hypothetical protein